ncbi:hypothetical protein [Streptomyces sp. 8L]|uniref:hypothetical protein n=1 Tax=Streptomyces sp. 8L TaxID=2877242 RepID=UPI001CD2673D|nr:hypothetical protein [Streptomyces sp. 8L]MCA1223565.1 hypothetical protein [Streptomyces sp. 8L]
MSKPELSLDEQNTIVGELMANVDTFEEEEFDELYDQLDADHQREVDGRIREWANNAVGDDNWDRT